MRAHSTDVLILTGPPGAGKTTVAGILARRSGRGAHVESDVFFDFIVAGRIEPWRPEAHDQNRLVIEMVAEVAAGYAAAGYFTVLDGIVIPRWFLAALRETLREAGLRPAYAVLRPPLGTCVRRVEGRRDGSLADPGAVSMLWSQFAELDELEANVVDVADGDAEEVADAVAGRLASGALAL